MTRYRDLMRLSNSSAIQWIYFNLRQWMCLSFVIVIHSLCHCMSGVLTVDIMSFSDYFFLLANLKPKSLYFGAENIRQNHFSGITMGMI